MVSVYDTKDYKVFFNSWVLEQPKKGHGEYRRLAQKLNVSTTLISQIFNGEKHPSLEIALEIAEYLGLGELETEFWLLQVEYAKAGSQKLKERFGRQLTARQEKAKKIENRIRNEIELSSEAKSTFYSSWMYSGIRLMAAVPEYSNVATIAKQLNLPRATVQKIAEFLLQNGLINEKSGKLQVGSQSTHIGSSSFLVAKHHQNWRIQGFQKMVVEDPRNIFFTGPVALSAEASQEIHALILSFIEKWRGISGPSESEMVRCLNVDWFEI
jgi:uncharacterized protein (TIGR02147 family)